MEPPKPRNPQTWALLLLLVNTTLFPHGTLTCLCRNSHLPSTSGVSHSHPAVPQLTQTGETFTVTVFCFLTPTKASCFLQICINRPRKFLFPCNLLYAGRSEGPVEGRNQPGMWRYRLVALDWPIPALLVVRPVPRAGGLCGLIVRRKGGLLRQLISSNVIIHSQRGN